MKHLLAVFAFFFLTGGMSCISPTYSAAASAAVSTQEFNGTNNPSASVGHTHGMEKVRPHEFNGDVRDLPLFPMGKVPSRRPYLPLLTPPPAAKSSVLATQPELQSPSLPSAPMPSPVQSFAGMSFNDSCYGGQCGAGWPPDTNGDVGLNYYIQAVNDAYAIYDKATGELQASFTENSLFSGGPTGTVCDTHSNGDPVVLYDQLANRWILTNFAFSFNGSGPVSPFYQCIAVSKTGNPVTGGWWLYALRMDPGGTGLPPVGTLNDYPKFGVWPDCLYMAANEFTMPSGSFAGTAFASFSRSDMYSGSALTWSLGFLPYPQNIIFTMIPSNLLGSSQSSLPPSGTPNYLVSESQTSSAFEVRKFTAGPDCGNGGTLSSPALVNQTPYYSGSSTNVVPQPGTTNKLDSLGDRLMQKVQYRKVGDAESLWVVHSVQTSGSSTVRPQWAQINVTGGAVATTPVQQQIYAPDSTLYRWMGSIAADSQGNAALGYSTSNSSNFPGISWSGRLAGDPLNSLPQTETQVIAGAGSQTNNCGGGPCHRWGDYSSMSVDPFDDCTFWYTNEYYDSQASGSIGNWHTRIASFKFSSCVPAGLPGAPSGVAATAGDSQATVSFTPPVSDGGSGIIFYTVTSDPGGITASGPSSPITVTGLTNGTAYVFTVTATNGVGTGPSSAPSNSVTPTPASITLSVAGAAGTSGGTVTDSGGISCSIASDGTTSGVCSESLASGSSVTLTAAPDVAGSSISWSGCSVSSGNTCDITLNASATVTTSFNLLQVLRVEGNTPVGTYSTIQGAFDIALTGDVIELQALTFTESPDFSSGASVTLAGGFDPAFSTQAGYSTISGALTISSGTVTVDRIAIY